jgi:hypothetical protein
MTMLRVNSDEAAELLVEHLSSQDDLAVERIAPGRIRVSVLGSFGAEAMRLELFLRLRAWEAAERSRGHDVRVELDDD